MADYATVTDVKRAVARDPERSEGSISSLSEEQYALALEQAQAEIDARLAARYMVPFDPVPGLVRSLAIDLAAYRAALAYYQERDITDELSVVRRYKQAAELLKALAKGEADLPDDVSTPADGVAATAAVGAPVDRAYGELSATFLDCPADPWGW